MGSPLFVYLFINWFPLFSYYKQCCYIYCVYMYITHIYVHYLCTHFCMDLYLHFFWVLRGWAIWYLYVYLYEGFPGYFSRMAALFTFALASVSYYLTLILVILMAMKCIPLWFWLKFFWRLIMLNIFSCACWFFVDFGEMSIRIFCPF